MYPFDDIGGNEAGESFPDLYSIAQIKQAAAVSGLIGFDPLLRDTSDLRPFSEGFSYHFTGNAVDFGDDEANGSPQQTQFADWVAHTFGPASLEIIHQNADGSYTTWKNGQVVAGAAFYGQATMDEHRNHVHWAITQDGLKSVLGSGADIVAGMAVINVGMPGPEGTVIGGSPLNMQDPNVRTAQALLQARGGLISPENGSHAVFAEVLHWFHVQAGLPDQGIMGMLTWERIVKPLAGK